MGQSGGVKLREKAFHLCLRNTKSLPAGESGGGPVALVALVTCIYVMCAYLYRPPSVYAFCHRVVREHVCVDIFQRGEGFAHRAIYYSYSGRREAGVGGGRRRDSVFGVCEEGRETQRHREREGISEGA